MDRMSTTDPVSTASPAVSPLSLATVAVVGLGTMGAGIAEILARSGREVIGIDVRDDAA
ncbi:3-hydroxyacyl-CoA dehydrogenase NAD-binding domain-containing protein, partial [Streptomyces sp. NPDC048845]|uniref:3-hydroxyacyl-CoA dehydrogenase NAD-binding domain-containing protein n=1 Tax=Streptomyces sp. NPDC048845 TaxID=3155390 RepID=UPI00342DF9B4